MSRHWHGGRNVHINATKNGEETPIVLFLLSLRCHCYVQHETVECNGKTSTLYSPSHSIHNRLQSQRSDVFFRAPERTWRPAVPIYLPLTQAFVHSLPMKGSPGFARWFRIIADGRQQQACVQKPRPTMAGPSRPTRLPLLVALSSFASAASSAQILVFATPRSDRVLSRQGCEVKADTHIATKPTPDRAGSNNVAGKCEAFNSGLRSLPTHSKGKQEDPQGFLSVCLRDRACVCTNT